MGSYKILIVKIMNDLKNSWEVETEKVNLQILERRVNSLNSIKTIREGDFVRTARVADS